MDGMSPGIVQVVTQRDAMVYRAVQRGAGHAPAIIAATGLASGVVYRSLGRLVQLGVVRPVPATIKPVRYEIDPTSPMLPVVERVCATYRL